MRSNASFAAEMSVLVITFLGLGPSHDAHAALMARGSAAVEFRAAGPAGLEIVGTTSALALSEQEGHVRISVALAQLTTGIALRDKHMRETYLEVAKYPTAVVDVTRADLKLPSDGATVSAVVRAPLTLHGITKLVDLRYRARADGGVLHVSGDMHIDMREFGIAVPSYFGVTVKPETDIVVKFDAADT